MRKLLEDIRSGSFARELIAEEEAGRPRFKELRKQAAAHQVEEVGRELRSLMQREGTPARELG